MNKKNQNSIKDTLKGIQVYTFTSNAHYKNQKDLLLVVFEECLNYAGVYTQSSCPSIPVSWCKQQLNKKKIRAILVNAGNANAFTGLRGENDLKDLVGAVSKKISCKIDEVAIASTGVIGEFLNTKPIIEAISSMSEEDVSSWHDAAESIMTTDTYPKIAYQTIKIDDEDVNIIGLAKGSGMIEPNMATMLSFIFTDANLSFDILNTILKDVVRDSFNSISVDGDTSTSDTVILVSTNAAQHELLTEEKDPRTKHLQETLQSIANDLAKKIVIDGEGATKLVEINTISAVSKDSAMKIAKSIANSPLVKTALYGEDPNWGRIVGAIGKSFEKIDINRMRLFIGDFLVAYNGAVSEDYTEEDVKNYMRNKEILITVELNQGKHAHRVWTCDLSHKYIDINTDYRS
tara:strand:- start:2340 stop:3551 length:1212 start_codon:yes stop_codon:yes gene_type:complete